MFRVLCLLAVATTALGWCGCATSHEGSFTTILSLSSTANITVLLGSTLVSTNAATFAYNEDPQALIQYLARHYAGGRAIAASQLMSRCSRFTKGGFQAMVTTPFIIAVRNASFLTWTRIELDLFAACASATETNRFRVSLSAVRVLHADLRLLDSDVDVNGPLIDTTTTVCRPRAVFWLNRAYLQPVIDGGLSAWLNIRTSGDIIQRIQICAPATDALPDGDLFFEQDVNKSYVHVCSLEDAMMCASSSMLLNTPYYGDSTAIATYAPTASISTQRIVYYYDHLPAAGSNNYLDIFVIDAIIQGRNRQIAMLVRPSETMLEMSLAALIQNVDSTTDDHASDLVVDPDDEYNTADCNATNELVRQHECDPMTFNDKSVHFGVYRTADDSFGIRGGKPCVLSVTSPCPLPRGMPPPVFSGATAAGITLEAASCVGIVAILTVTLMQWFPRKSVSVAATTGEIAAERTPKPVVTTKRVDDRKTKLWNQLNIVIKNVKIKSS